MLQNLFLQIDSMTTKNKTKIAFIVYVFIGAICIAQPPPPVGDNKPLPIDGGVLIAAFIALCYGAKKLMKK